MMSDISLNDRAVGVFEEMAARAAELRIGVRELPGGGRLIDAGVEAVGGLEAGLCLARLCLADLGRVDLVAGRVGDLEATLVQVATDHPVAACMASQYAGWRIAVETFFAMGSGPMRAAAGREELFETIGLTEEVERVAGVLEVRAFPDEAVVKYICERAKMEADGLHLAIAPTASQAGGIQVVARSVETALHKLFELGFDLSRVASGFGTAPLPPVAKDDLSAIGRTNDAVLYGGRVTLWVRGDDDSLAEIGAKTPSSASSDFGEPFAAIFEKHGRDFYKLDPMLFSPAEVTFVNLDTGRVQRFGQVEPEILRTSFGI